MSEWRNPCPVCGARQPPCPPSCGFHPSCDVDWGSAMASQRCVRNDGHGGAHVDADGREFGDTGPTRAVSAYRPGLRIGGAS